MPLSNYSSEDSDDSLTTIFEDSGKLSATNSVLEAEWDAVESTLYDHTNSCNVLKPNIIQECHLWQETFPYLRVKGTRIDNETNTKKLKLRKQILGTVVNHLVMKIAGEGLNISADNGVQRPAAPKKESYFERGKVKNHEALTNASSLRLQSTNNVAGTTSTKLPPRSILKKSSKKFQPKIDKGASKRTHIRNQMLPKINTRSNNWLNRSELHNASYTLPPKKSNESPSFSKGIAKQRLILPPISPHL